MRQRLSASAYASGRRFHAKLALVAAFCALIACNGNTIYTFARTVKNKSPERLGVRLCYPDMPWGMQQKPIVNDFHDMLYKMSDGKVDVEAYNTFVMGAFIEGNRYSNLLNPRSKFKDTWFGVYLVFDDTAGKGRRFMLVDPEGDASALDNIRDSAMISVPALDQKLIVYSSHQNQPGYTFDTFQDEFFFEPITVETKHVSDGQGRTWKRLDGSSRTIAALTDTDSTDMKLFSSIRVYAGLPTDSLYSIVEPWHTITIHGSVLARYFRCARTAFWALVYYNGTEFSTRQGVTRNTWNDTDLRHILDQAFRELDIGCLEPAAAAG